jgi:CBS domain containing-hemolysin-like protein
MLWGLALVALLVITTAFFVAVEFALVSVRRTRIEQLVSEGNGGAVLVKKGLDNLQTYLAAAQVGITMASLGLGALGEPVVATMITPLLEAVLPQEAVERVISLHTISFIIALLLVTIVELVLGETVPKIAAIQRAERMALATIRPMGFFLIFFRPLIWVINVLSNFFLRLAGLPPDAEHSAVYTVEELEMMVTSSRQAGILDRTEEGILRRVFDFGDLLVRQVMRPRTEIDAIPVNATFEQVVAIVAHARHSRFPVYEGDLDHIIGVVHVKDLYLDMVSTSAAAVDPQGSNGRETLPVPATYKIDIRGCMRPIEAVPETLNVGELLNMMKQRGLQIALVVDEYGGTSGIVTLEDVLEEIVGDVRDEFEVSDGNTAIQVTPTGTIVDGLAPIHDVNEVLGMDLQSESDTLGGFVFETLGRKPEIGDEVRYNGYTFTVDALDGLRIARVRITQSGAAARGQAEPPSDEV